MLTIPVLGYPWVPNFDPIGHISHTWCRRRREEMHQPFQPIEPFKKGLMFFVNQQLDSTLMLNILGFNKIHDGDLKIYYNLKTINHVWSFFSTTMNSVQSHLISRHFVFWAWHRTQYIDPGVNIQKKRGKPTVSIGGLITSMLVYRRVSSDFKQTNCQHVFLFSKLTGTSTLW